MTFAGRTPARVTRKAIRTWHTLSAAGPLAAPTLYQALHYIATTSQQCAAKSKNSKAAQARGGVCS